MARILRAAVFLVTALVVLAAAASFVLLRTETGLKAALSLGTRIAASENFGVTVGGAEGALGADFTLTDIRVADRDGVWLTVDRARLAWHPAALFSGVFAAEALDLGTVSVARRPVPGAAPATASSSSQPPLGLRIDRISLAELALAEPVAGTEARLTATGSARLVDPAEGLRLTLDARRTDGQEGTLTARLGYVPDSGAIDARVTAAEPEGGVVARLLDLPGLPPVRLLIDGTGRLDAGLVTLTLEAGGDGRLNATTRLARAPGGIRVDMDAGGAFGAILPVAYQPLFEGRTALNARLVVAGDGSDIAVERAHLTSSGLTLDAEGLVDLAGARGDLRVDVAAGEAARFAGLLPAPLAWRELRIAGRHTGSLTAPTVTARITGGGIAYGDRSARAVAGDVTLRADGDALALSADLTAEGLALGIPNSETFIGDSARVVAEATRQADGTLDVRRLDVDGAAGTFGFTGTLSPEAVEGRLAVDNARVTLTADVAAAQLSTAPAGSVSLSGTADGAPVTGSARFAMADGGVRLEDVDLRTRSVTLAGDLLATPDAPRGDLILSVGDLADLAAFLPVAAQGRLDGRIRLDGQGARASAQIDMQAGGLTIQNITVRSAALNAVVEDPFGARVVNGRLEARDVGAGVAVPRIGLSAQGPLDAARLTLDAEALGGTLAAAGTLAVNDMALALERLDLTRQTLKVALAGPSLLRLADGAVATEGLTLTANGGRITARGSAGGTLGLDLAFERLPLALAEVAAPGLGLAGTLDGTATLSGPAAAPSGRYALTVAGLSAPQTRDLGLGAFAVRAEGTLADGRTQMSASATGGGANLRLTGSAPLGAGNLDLRATGTVDAGLMNTRLAASGERLAGTVSLDAAIGGTTAAPSVSGSARLAGGRFTSPGLGLDLTNMTAALTGDGNAVSLSAFSAATPGGGRLTGQGRVTLDPGAGFPGDIALTAANAQLADTRTVTARADARIRIEGPLARAPRIGGEITVRRMDITLPERLPAGSSAIEVEHRNAPPEIRRQVARRAEEERQRAAPSAFDAPLDLTVNAANQIFIRGQGIESELSGQLRVRGTTSAPQIDSGFEMRRGTLSVLGQRLTFTRGIVTFPGEITPVLDLVAETRSGDITAMIAVTGSASQPAFALSSEPSLPQDEVMARLLFNRATGELSPGQAIQIAQALASLSGGGPGALDGIRRGLGVDTLDVTTDEGGGPAVAVGRYINDNISIGARQGTTPESSRVTVDIDVTERVRVKGEAGADGNSKVGIGVEWEY